MVEVVAIVPLEHVKATGPDVRVVDRILLFHLQLTLFLIGGGARLAQLAGVHFFPLDLLAITMAVFVNELLLYLVLELLFC